MDETDMTEEELDKAWQKGEPADVARAKFLICSEHPFSEDEMGEIIAALMDGFTSNGFENITIKFKPDTREGTIYL